LSANLTRQVAQFKIRRGEVVEGFDAASSSNPGERENPGE